MAGLRRFIKRAPKELHLTLEIVCETVRNFIKESLRANFRQTTAASINLIQTIYLIFATVVAFGVVYNNARISLAERAR